jgi:drug/metabolite transporter (DMT)-like permease
MHDKRGLPAVLVGASLLGFAAIFVKWGMLGGASPLAVGFYRMLIALPIALVLARWAAPLRFDKHSLWGIAAGVAFACDLMFWHRSMLHTSAANSTFIVCGLAPVWVALFSIVFYGLHYRWLGWLGQVLCLSGALFLALARGAAVGTGQGEWLAMAASLCYAAFSLTISKCRSGAPAQHALFWMSFGSLVALLFAEGVEQVPLHGFSTLAWLSLFGLGLVAQILAWWLITQGLGKVEVALGSLGLGMQQVATPFLAAWLLAEPLRPLGLLGGGLIVTGIYLVAKGRPSLAGS